MKLLPVLEMLFVNAVLIVLFALITQNYALRLAYWGKTGDGFTPTMTRYPLFFVTSAVKGSTRIPGLLSVDWQQVVILVLIVVDVVFVFSALRARAPRNQQPSSGT
ncbi:MAG TPA: hypothetical protein VGS04_05930 [Nitrososphaerales archaeon]|nr:hypothetical protein [Nitrososphaerales archaeon]